MTRNAPIWKPPPRTRFPVATINPAQCAACGLCARLCRIDAIEVMGHARVDAARCASCGTCLGSCPEGAIEME